MPDIIQEYLVALGWKIDEQGWTRFNNTLAMAAKSAAGTTSAILAVASSIGVTVEQVSRRFEELYWLGQRTGETVENLRALEYAGRQIGLSFGQSKGAVESFAASLRQNPGLSGLLKGMGIDAAEQPLEAMLGLVERLRKQFGPQGYFVASRMAGIFGIDEQTFLHLWNNLDKLRERMDEQKQRQRDAGIDTDELAAKSNKFSQALNKLEDSFKTLGERITVDFVDPATEVVGAIEKIIGAITKLDAEAKASIALWPLLALINPTAAAGAIVFSPTTANKREAGRPWNKPLTAEDVAGLGGAGEKGGGGGRGGNSLRDQMIDQFARMGWTREQATGIVANLHAESGLKTNAKGDSGLAYGLAQWHPERQRDFERWAGKPIQQSSIEEQLAFVQYELTQGGRRGAGQKLHNAKSAAEAGAVVSMYYEEPFNTYGEARKRAALAQQWFRETPQRDAFDRAGVDRTAPLAGAPAAGPGVNIIQTTSITVAAGGTAAETARRVKDAQTEVNGDLVRNTVGAIR